MCLVFFFFYNCEFVFCFFFFFSSRRRHTRCSRDWSSDVCSSDLCRRCRCKTGHSYLADNRRAARSSAARGSEERRVGKECRSRWSPYHNKKKKENGHNIRMEHMHEARYDWSTSKVRDR